MNLSDEEKISTFVNKLNSAKFEYNRQQLKAIKDRAHQFLAFSLIGISIIIGLMSQERLEFLYNNSLPLLAVQISGFIILLIAMRRCYDIMTRPFEDPLLDPEKIFNAFSHGAYDTVMDELRNSIFEEHKNTDKRNEQVQIEMAEIYNMIPSSFAIILIPWFLSYLL